MRYEKKSIIAKIGLTGLDLVGYFFYFLSLKFMFNKGKIKNPKKILILQLDKIGDVILSTPAIKKLKKEFPKSKIDILVSNYSKEVLSLNPNINRVFFYDSVFFYRKNLSLKQILLNIKKVIFLRKENYDLVIDLRSDIRSIFIAWLIGKNERVSQEIRSGGFLLTHIVPYQGIEHEVKRKLEIINFIKDERKKFVIKPEIFWDKDDEKKVFDLLKQNKIKEFIVIHPFAGWKSREWPRIKFFALTNWIIENKRLSVIFLGSNDERKNVDEILGRVNLKNRRKTYNFAGLFSINQIAFLVKRAKLFVGNDSGIGHVASTTETPIVSLFGPNDPNRYAPFSQKMQVIYHKLPCSPCPQIKCKVKPNCMEKITIKEVVNQIKNAC